MKVLQVYNEQRSRFGGEAAVIELTTRVLAARGHDSRIVMKSSRGIERSLWRKACAFAGGIFNVRSWSEMRRILKQDPPDIVHVHSLYPRFSPSVLLACRQAGIPVVMHVHSHILTCPNWYHLRQGRICEECLDGREYRCFLTNCRGNWPESLGYALRSAFARSSGLIRDNVSAFIVLSDFARRRLADAGYERDRIVVVPNATAMPTAVSPVLGEYVAFAGRISPEKGLATLLEAAALAPGIPLSIAGDGPELDRLRASAAGRVRWVGRLQGPALSDFYRAARLVVVPSICLEQFGLVAIEAMAQGLPVIASRIGGLPEVVDEGKTGLLFAPGDSAELAAALQRLWQDPELCERMGRAGREKALARYGEDAYADHLMAVYEGARGISGRSEGESR